MYFDTLPRKKLLISILLSIATLVAFWQVKDCSFINYDDPLYITNNQQVQSGLNWQNLKWAFTATEAANWHPITWISHCIDCQLYGLNPAGHHVTSLLLHIANVILLFHLLLQMTGAFWRSSFVAALFALHPLNVESVAWIS